MKYFLLAFALLAFAMSSAWAQDLITVKAKAEQEVAETVKLKAEIDQKVQIELTQAMGASIAFDSKIVKGAPYSATSESETVQMLMDGNRIRNKTTTQIYRDSAGRTRKEIMGKTPDAPVQVFISDPVEGVNYSLNSKQRLAFKSSSTIEVKLVAMKKKLEEEINNQKPATTTSANLSKEAQGKPWDQMTEDEKRLLTERKLRAEAEMNASGKIVAAAGGKVVTDKTARSESLGQQNIEGVICEGKRTTVTIAAGTIGNELPINIVTEEWYSPELQALVLTKRTDPRNGETTYRLTNINRSEPAHSLFEVPSDYTVQDAPKPLYTIQDAAKPMMKRAKEEQ